MTYRQHDSDDQIEALDDASQDLMARYREFVAGQVHREQPTLGFHERCQFAAESALALAKLRDERERVGAVAVAFDDYLRSIARATHVSLDTICSWAGLTEISELTTDTAQRLAKVAKAIGLSTQEAILQFRLMFAAQHGGLPLFVGARFRSGATSPHAVTEINRTLTEVQSSFTPAQRAELQTIEDAVAAHFLLN